MNSMDRGVYLLVGLLEKVASIDTGSRTFHLQPGFYYYCGSAMKSLSARIKRHTHSVGKTQHWHIDYLTEAWRLIAAVPYVVADNRLEHQLARIFSEFPDVAVVPGFGSSDCNCYGHLFTSEQLIEEPVMRRLFRWQMEQTICALQNQYAGIQTPVEKFRTPWEILVSCIISLRTKDEVTGPAADRLLKAAPDPDQLAEMDPEQIGKLIFPAGFYRTKGKNLQQIARIVRDRWNGRVPDDKETLLALPGVGIKTANLVLADGFGQDEICVDTHVHRICNRLGWIRTETPEQSEKILKVLLPSSIIRITNGLMVKHGQNICKPIKPRCTGCPVRNLCHTGMKHENHSP